MKPYVLREGGKNSVILTIPSSILAESGLKIGDAIEFSASKNNILVRKYGVI